MTDTELRERLLQIIRHASSPEDAVSQFPKAYKEPVIIDGKTYHRKLVSDGWESLLSQMSTAGYPKELIKRISSQIKELE